MRLRILPRPPRCYHLNVKEVLMGQVVSKSSFQDRALEYLREVEKTGEELIITDQGKPVLKLIRYHQNPKTVLESLRGSVVRYDDPMEPVGEEDWETLR
jgi:antitoxin (DNA-binding transcriptional repressor) of toxin-antitoxin stability system